jgi:DNA-binding response OmpR family regulator
MSLKILVIDDDTEIHTIIRSYLKTGYQIDSAITYGQGEELLKSNIFDLLIVDLNLRNYSGLDLVRNYKPYHSSTKFFILTANDKEQVEIDCHKNLVDEYIKKPVSKSLLLAIIDKHFQKNIKLLSHGKLRIDETNFESWIEDQTKKEALELTPKEFKLLVKLAKNLGKTFTREELLYHVWGQDSHSTFRTVDMHVSNLRKKITSSQVSIETIRSVGYQLILLTK